VHALLCALLQQCTLVCSVAAVHSCVLCCSSALPRPQGSLCWTYTITRAVQAGLTEGLSSLQLQPWMFTLYIHTHVCAQYPKRTSPCAARQGHALAPALCTPRCPVPLCSSTRPARRQRQALAFVGAESEVGQVTGRQCWPSRSSAWLILRCWCPAALPQVRMIAAYILLVFVLPPACGLRVCPEVFRWTCMCGQCAAWHGGGSSCG